MQRGAASVLRKRDSVGPDDWSLARLSRTTQTHPFHFIRLCCYNPGTAQPRCGAEGAIRPLETPQRLTCHC